MGVKCGCECVGSPILNPLNSSFKLCCMYVIAVYDVNEKRVGKMLKLCRRYLNWIQNSVFEGEITPVKLQELVVEAKKIMEKDEDSFILFKSRDARWLDKEVIGLERMSTDNFL